MAKKLWSPSFVTVAAVVVVWWMTDAGVEAVADELLKIACSDMTPRHPGYKPENVRVPCPYRLIVDTPTVVPGEMVNITLTSVDESTPFKGFMIQARDTADYILGTYLPDCVNGGIKSHHTISCSNGYEPYNTIIQSNSEFKVKETFTWIAPLTLKGSFKFKFTVVHDFEHFWTNEETNDIPVEKISDEEYAKKNSVNHEYYIYKLYIKNCFARPVID